MLFTPTMAAVFIGAVIFAAVLWPLAINGTADDEPKWTVDSDFDAKEARRVAIAMVRDHVVDDPYGLFNRLPRDRREPWEVKLPELLDVLSRLRAKLDILEERYGDKLFEGRYDSTVYETAASEYTQVTDSFRATWQELATLNHEIQAKVRTCSQEVVEANMARCQEKIQGERSALTALSSIGERKAVLAFETALARIKVQLTQVEHRSRAAEQLASLECEVTIYCRDRYAQQQKRSEACSAFVTETEKGIAWIRRHRPQATNLERLYQLHDRLVEEESYRSPRLTLQDLEEIRAEVMNITASEQIAHGVRTNTIELAMAA